jgi:hypothetical protein
MQQQSPTAYERRFLGTTFEDAYPRSDTIFQGRFRFACWCIQPQTLTKSELAEGRPLDARGENLAFAAANRTLAADYDWRDDPTGSPALTEYSVGARRQLLCFMSIAELLRKSSAAYVASPGVKTTSVAPA